MRVEDPLGLGVPGSSLGQVSSLCPDGCVAEAPAAHHRRSCCITATSTGGLLRSGCLGWRKRHMSSRSILSASAAAPATESRPAPRGLAGHCRPIRPRRPDARAVRPTRPGPTRRRPGAAGRSPDKPGPDGGAPCIALRRPDPPAAGRARTVAASAAGRVGSGDRTVQADRQQNDLGLPRLPNGVGFFPHPYSAVSSAFLAVGLPSRGDNGVTSFTFAIDPGFRSCLSAGGANRDGGISQPPYLTTYLLVQA